MKDDEPEALQNWERWHGEFHAAIISACRSRYVLKFCAHLYDASNRYRYLARLAPGVRDGAYEEHKKIADAVLARNADQAVSLLDRSLPPDRRKPGPQRAAPRDRPCRHDAYAFGARALGPADALRDGSLLRSSG